MRWKTMALAAALLLAACGGTERPLGTGTAANPASDPPIPTSSIPTELGFKRIEKQFQQQQQQFGPRCPELFTMGVDEFGDVDVEDDQGQRIFEGAVPDSDFSDLTVAAAELLSGDGLQGFDCQQDAFGQIFTQTVRTRDGKTCDISQGPKSIPVSQKMDGIAQKSCRIHLPKPKPRRHHRHKPRCHRDHDQDQDQDQDQDSEHCDDTLGEG